MKSPIGKMVLAIKDNEIRANYLGINVSKQIHNIYMMSGILASLGGALMVVLVGHVTPEDTAYWTKSGEFVFVAILSGVTNVIAPLLGSLFFEFIRSFALYLFPNTWQMTIGIILIIGIIYLPEGLGSIFNKIESIRNAIRSKKSTHKSFGSVAAAENINFSMEDQEIVGIIGSNGAGKTTFCNIITGYTQADKGDILYKGEDISRKSVLEIKIWGFTGHFKFLKFLIP